MSEIEKMYKLVNVAKPVIKKWYYDGYYEDFSWESSEEDCTELLKYFDNSIDKLNNRIQQMKKEENTKYDRYTDSVDTEFGRVEKAYIVYPSFTAEKQIELIKWLSTKELKIRTNKQPYAVYIGLLGDDNTCFFGCEGLYFEQTLAELVNFLWQDLTKVEQNEIKNILKG